MKLALLTAVILYLIPFLILCFCMKDSDPTKTFENDRSPKEKKGFRRMAE